MTHNKLDVHDPMWARVREALRRPCRRCDGVGFTQWDALWDGFANIIGHLVGRPRHTVCHRCDGTGKEPSEEKEVDVAANDSGMRNSDEQVAEVKALCERVGYGFVIDEAAKAWAKRQWGSAAMGAWLISLGESFIAKADSREEGET